MQSCFRKIIHNYFFQYMANSNLHCVYEELNSLAVRKSRNIFGSWVHCEKVKCIVPLRFHCCVMGRRKTGQGCIGDCSKKVPYNFESSFRILYIPFLCILLLILGSSIVNQCFQFFYLIYYFDNKRDIKVIAISIKDITVFSFGINARLITLYHEYNTHNAYIIKIQHCQ